MMNGFDGYAEEIMSCYALLPTRPFDITAFDGPDRGHTALAGMPLNPQWERPNCHGLRLLQIQRLHRISGGYLVIRAAAYTPRVPATSLHST